MKIKLKMNSRRKRGNERAEMNLGEADANRAAGAYPEGVIFL